MLLKYHCLLIRHPLMRNTPILHSTIYIKKVIVHLQGSPTVPIIICSRLPQMHKLAVLPTLQRPRYMKKRCGTSNTVIHALLQLTTIA